jgi:hypothetical protein
MKKITVLSLILVMLSFAASAQVRPGLRQNKRNNRQFTRPEKMELRKDVVRYKMMKNRAGRDGVVTPMERRRLRHAKCETRRDAFRFKHNGRRRVI